MNAEKENFVGLDNALELGSVAHQIIGEFFSKLAEVEEYKEIAQKLKVAISDGKPTESIYAKQCLERNLYDCSSKHWDS